MQSRWLKRFYDFMLGWPSATLSLNLVIVVALGAWLPALVKDTTTEAFIQQDHPVLIYRDQVRDLFGLKDPMVIAVEHNHGSGVFTPEVLRLIQDLTVRVQDMPGINRDKVLSLATENDVRGVEGALEVEGFLENLPATREEAGQIAQRVTQFPAYMGTLVSRDLKMTLIVAEMERDADARKVYLDLVDLTQAIERPEPVRLYVAGQGATSGYLAAYIDADAKRLNPFSVVIITSLLFLAYRTLRASLIPNLIVVGTVAVSLGAMAALGVPFYVITNSLPVILIGIAVAAAIHIFGQYYREAARAPDASSEDIVRRTMYTMWRPVTLAALTTVAGFIGLALSADMPPVARYGWFGALGVAAAWWFSVTLLPAVLIMLKPQASKVVAAEQTERASGVMPLLGLAVYRFPRFFIGVALILIGAGLYGASRVEMNEVRIANFRPSEPLYQADQAINARMNGTYYLDVALETADPEGLLKPENLRRIERLQRFLEEQPEIFGTTSIVDYLKQLNKSLHADDPDQYRLPDSEELTAQLLLLYSISGDPTDFEEEIDSEYQRALLRAYLRTDNFKVIQPVVERAQRYLDQEFNSPELRGELTGAVKLTEAWLAPLKRSHALGVAAALGLVLMTSALFLRSLVFGLMCTIQVSAAVVLIYGVMGWQQIWLGVGTSMFASIAIGLGVDFAIHTLDRFRYLVRDQALSLAEAFNVFYASTGRALLFNLFAIMLGFGVLCFSKVPPLQYFGLLVAVAVLGSFLMSVTLIPAWLRVWPPKVLGLERGSLQPALNER